MQIQTGALLQRCPLPDTEDREDPKREDDDGSMLPVENAHDGSTHQCEKT